MNIQLCTHHMTGCHNTDMLLHVSLHQLFLSLYALSINLLQNLMNFGAILAQFHKKLDDNPFFQLLINLHFDNAQKRLVNSLRLPQKSQLHTHTGFYWITPKLYKRQRKVQRLLGLIICFGFASWTTYMRKDVESDGCVLGSFLFDWAI